jgi:prepilin-type N-terminal cleavage/methylation domain-containing protein
MTNAQLGHPEHGFTIVEVMVAIVVLALALVGVTSLLSASISGNVRGRTLTEASTLASQHIETIMSLPNNHVWLTDRDGDGTAQDVAPTDNGIDDDNDGGVVPAVDGNRDFGLDDIGVKADWSTSDNSNEYSILWNVAVDEPVPNVNTIRVIVMRQGNGNNRRVAYDFYRLMSY